MRKLYLILALMAIFVTFPLSADRIDTSGVQDELAPGEIWFHVGYLDYCALEGENVCVVKDANIDLFGYLNGQYGGNVAIPEYVEEEGVKYTVEGIDAFEYCWALKELHIPSTVKWIKRLHCLVGLEELEIPESVEKIQGCNSLRVLKSLTLPSHPLDLTQAFDEELYSLQEVIANSPEPYPVGEWTFYDTPVENCVLVVPDEAVEKYREAPKWKEFGTIVGRSGYTGIASAKAADPYSIKPIPKGFEISDYEGNLKVHDISGKTILDQKVNATSSFNLPSGIYFIHTPERCHKLMIR